MCARPSESEYETVGLISSDGKVMRRESRQLLGHSNGNSSCGWTAMQPLMHDDLLQEIALQLPAPNRCGFRFLASTPLEHPKVISGIVFTCRLGNRVRRGLVRFSRETQLGEPGHGARGSRMGPRQGGIPVGEDAVARVDHPHVLRSARGVGAFFLRMVADDWRPAWAGHPAPTVPNQRISLAQKTDGTGNWWCSRVRVAGLCAAVRDTNAGRSQ